MIFASVPTVTAAGGILAHGQVVGRERWSKGRRLSVADTAAALDAGIAELTIARPDAADTPEDVAAAAVAQALAGPGVAALPAAHGRVNLAARAAGVAVLDAAAIAAVNAVDEGITVATLPPFARVAAGEIVATVKIIPYAVAAQAVAAACSASAAPAVAVAAFRPVAATLFQTRLPGTDDKALAKTLRVTRARLVAIGGTLADGGAGPHEVAALAARLKVARAPLLLVAAASATADRRDVVPAAIIAAGGAVERVGMPVDPGNLLVLGRIGDRTVIGLPGCARSPKRNGFDWVLERHAAGLTVTAGDIAAMGVGGLLPEAERPQPRAAGAVP